MFYNYRVTQGPVADELGRHMPVGAGQPVGLTGADGYAEHLAAGLDVDTEGDGSGDRYDAPSVCDHTT